MACAKCNSHTCKGNCKKVSVTRQIINNNNSVGRDAEQPYDTYVRYGGTLSEEEWALRANNSVYNNDNWT